MLGGFAAGFINTLAGGGSMLTVPLLHFVGLPMDAANGTNRVGILIQNIFGVMGFRSKGVAPWRTGIRLIVPVCLGALAGAGLAANVDALLLKRIFGVVLILLCGVVVLQPTRFLKRAGEDESPPRLNLKVFSVFLAVGFWGGFAQVGVGFLFLAGLSLATNLDLVYANAVKVFLILLFTIPSIIVFAAHRQVWIVPGLVMAAGNAAGAWVASVTSVKKGAAWVRSVLVVAAFGAALKLLGVLDFLWGLLVGY